MLAPWIWLALTIGLVAQIATAAPEYSSRRERFLLSVLKFHNSRCQKQIDGRTVEGVCQHRAECRFLRGNHMGSCAVFGTCCAIERTCNNATSLKVSYFTSPPAGQENFCNFKVDVTNRDICQIRLDFEEFSLAQPTKTDPLSLNPYVCQKDAFSVTSLNSGTNSFPNLCGENAGQHIYVPVNNSQGASSIILSFMIASRVANPKLPAARWRIKITQIECNGMTNDYSSASTSFNTWNHHHWDKQLPANDHIKQAPPGCLQYHTERTGTYETFNYMDGEGPYIANLNYAICFRKESDVCGLRHTPVKFSLAANSNIHNYTNSDCDETGNVAMPNQDYLYIPEGFTTQMTIASKFCGTAINSTNFVTSVAPGPLYTFFRSDGVNNPLIKEKGFRINYEMINSGC